MRLQVSDLVQQAEACAGEEDFDCALQTLARAERTRDLNSFERAYILTRYANIHLTLEDYPAATAAYEQILTFPAEELNPAVIQVALRNLASLYLALEPPRARDALSMLERWMALPNVIPSPQDWYQKATIHATLDEYQNGVEAVLRAIEIAQAAGRLGEEVWYSTLYFFYRELEDQEKAIDTLEILVENWTKWQHMQQLAGQLSERDGPGDSTRVLALWEAAYDAGWLERSGDLTALATLHMTHGAPYKGAKVLEEGLADGDVESTDSNWRLLATALRMAGENEKAIPALRRASSLASDGNLDLEVARSHYALADWDSCVDASRSALNRGGLNREDSANMLLGQCLIYLGQHEQAAEALRAAARSEASRDQANQMLGFVQREMERLADLERSLEQVAKERADRAARRSSRNN